MNYTEFINAHNGRGTDYDGAYGVQCFTKNHYVNMADGTYKAIQDIVIGDQVLGCDNEINTVTQIHAHEARVFKVRTNLTEFEVTEEHPFLFADGTFASIFDVGNKEPVLYDKVNEAESGLTDEELKFLGFWLGDGSLVRYKDRGRRPDIRITYGEKKKKFIESLGIISSFVDRSNAPGAKDAYISKKDHPILTDHIYACYDEDRQKQLPMIYTNREYELILEGYIEADGFKDSSGNRCVVTSTSKKLLMSIQAICILLGYKSCAIRYKNRSEKPIVIKGKVVKNVKDIYTLSIRRDGIDGKTELKHVEDIGEQMVYNIGVDGSHTFICNNYKVHNCVDLIKAYLKKVFGITPGAWGNAHAYYDNFYNLPGLYKNFNRITNTASFVPQKGDIAVWRKGSGFPYGHIAICNGEGNTSWFKSYDQNWTGRNDRCALITHNYNMFAGVLRPKNQSLITGKSGSGSAVANSTNTNYKVKVTAGRLNVRSGAGTNYRVNTVVKQNEIYTIVETKGGWGRLKSGAGWISLTYTVRC